MGITDHLEHRGQPFLLTKLSETLWKVTDENGRNYGTLVLIAAEGEEAEPVYGVQRPADEERFAEGSDWKALVGGLINEVNA